MYIFFNSLIQIRTWTFDGPIWTTARNPFEAIQWTMAYEIRGSVIVYLAILVTCGFTPSCRLAIFLILMAFSVYCGEFLADMPFYTGALLADLAIVIGNPNANTSAASSRFRFIKNYWPITLGLFGLILGSYPPDGTDLSAWSRALTRLANVSLPYGCTSLEIFLTQGHTHGLFLPSVPYFSSLQSTFRPSSEKSFPTRTPYSSEAFPSQCTSFIHS
jgi:hypothetical protein